MMLMAPVCAVVGLPSSYENSRESLAAISKGLAELELKEDAISLVSNEFAKPKF
jgi:hypothetical protein